MTYDEGFFASIEDDARRSAAVIVPYINDLFQPRSVVDVGCGMGQFLDEFRTFGVDDVLGIDGHQFVDRLPEFPYVYCDLTQGFARHAGRRFDLAISLEVAEHLPPENAAAFVFELTTLAPVVLFSAACPSQGGEGHLNEQWPDYWIDLFADQNYEVSGRPRIDLWDNSRIAYWYRQNMLLFRRRDYTPEDANRASALFHYFETSTAFSLGRLVHPVLFGNRVGVKFEGGDAT